MRSSGMCGRTRILWPRCARCWPTVLLMSYVCIICFWFMICFDSSMWLRGGRVLALAVEAGFWQCKNGWRLSSKG